MISEFPVILRRIEEEEKPSKCSFNCNNGCRYYLNRFWQTICIFSFSFCVISFLSTTHVDIQWLTIVRFNRKSHRFLPLLLFTRVVLKMTQKKSQLVSRLETPRQRDDKIIMTNFLISFPVDFFIFSPLSLTLINLQKVSKFVFSYLSHVFSTFSMNKISFFYCYLRFHV